MDKNSNLEFSRMSQFFVNLDLIQTKLTNSLTNYEHGIHQYHLSSGVKD
ncbi:MAG: hypothetical protein OXF84_07710 [Bacteroidetes bacterium]|nr:hypothetical protein [Bacteroidota bacterium]